MTQMVPEVLGERIAPDGFDGSIDSIGMVIVSPSGGSAQINPVCRLIAGASKPFGIDKGLQKIDRMMVAFLPVSGKTSGHLAQKIRGQIRDSDPMENEKPGIIGNQMKVFLANLWSPTDEAVPAANVAGR